MPSAAATKLWVSRQRVKCNKPNNENRPNTTPTNPIPHTQLHTHHFEPPQFPVTPLTLDPVPVSIPCSLEIAITPEVLQLSMSQKVHRLMQKAIINKNSKNNSRQHPSSRSHGSNLGRCTFFFRPDKWPWQTNLMAPSFAANAPQDPRAPQSPPTGPGMTKAQRQSTRASWKEENSGPTTSGKCKSILSEEMWRVAAKLSWDSSQCIFTSQ